MTHLIIQLLIIAQLFLFPTIFFILYIPTKFLRYRIEINLR